MTTKLEMLKPHTLVDIFFSVVDRGSNRIMMYETNGHWHSISAFGFYRRVVGVAKALKSWGIKRGDRVAILSENRPEWAIADFATLLIGAASVPIYATLTSEQCTQLLANSGARVIFVSSPQQWKKVANSSGTAIERVVMMDESSSLPEDIHSMRSLIEAGPMERDLEFDHSTHTVSPDDLATLIYTSGTTGVPKGVMLTHGNLAANLSTSLEGVALNDNELAISFLPLSHITARHVDFALLYRGTTLAYCPVIEDVPRMMAELKPTIFVAVPRVYEKIHNQALRAANHGLKKKIFNWALKVGEQHIEPVLAGKVPKSAQWKLADKIVFSKIRERMGGNVRLFISGGAPLGRELAYWFAKVGIRIHEGYGLTETSPVIALNTPSSHKIGSVGRPLANVEVKIAPDGEILVRGPNVFKGYWNLPQETQDAFDGDWFKTGDVGNIDVDGYLSVTDRKKDLIKTSGGKFIAPQPIENSLKANPLISEAAVIGDRRRFPSVVIAPSFAQLEEWAIHNDIQFSSREELAENPRVQALYEEIVGQVNNNLAKFEKLKKVLVLHEEFSVADGTLTPTMKLRRRNVEARYQAHIERLYVDHSHLDAAAS